MKNGNNSMSPSQTARVSLAEKNVRIYSKLTRT